LLAADSGVAGTKVAEVTVALPLGSPMAELAIDLLASAGQATVSCPALGTVKSSSLSPPHAPRRPSHPMAAP